MILTRREILSTLAIGAAFGLVLVAMSGCNNVPADPAKLDTHDLRTATTQAFDHSDAAASHVDKALKYLQQ